MWQICDVFLTNTKQNQQHKLGAPAGGVGYTQRSSWPNTCEALDSTQSTTEGAREGTRLTDLMAITTGHDLPVSREAGSSASKIRRSSQKEVGAVRGGGRGRQGYNSRNAQQQHPGISSNLKDILTCSL